MSISYLPPLGEMETKKVLKKAVAAHQKLAELKGIAASIPNEKILIDTLILQEARESSAIENIISTFDEVYQSNWSTGHFASAAAKEVHSYAKALEKGFELVKQNGLFTNNHILEIQAIIEHNKAGFRKLPGTKLLKEVTGEVVYTPPQDYDTIVDLMRNLEEFINNDDFYDADILVKMALIHHQFESVHPFYDGNGRTGRIINILYLIQKGLLNLPILYLSRYIINHKADYYRLLQQVREKNLWEDWLLFIIESVEITAKESIEAIIAIRDAMQQYKNHIKAKLPKLYSQDLLDNIFKHPYTKIEFLMDDLQVSRGTAVKYLNELVKEGLLIKQRSGRDNYFINKSLYGLLVTRNR
jgi:Fic family protein